MPIVRNTVKRPDGTPLAGVVVTVRLVATVTGVAPGYVGSSDYAILSEYTAMTGGDGQWSLTVAANDTITPAGTVYEVAERPPSGPRVVSYFSVPASAGAGPLWIGDFLTDPPATVQSSALGAHLLGTVDAHDASAISFAPTGTVAATDVQAAIVEVAAEAGGTDVVPKSLVDAKGDLIAGTANDTVARVAVGADRSALEADSTATPGVAWVSRPRFFDRWRSGGYYSIGAFGASGTVSVLTQSKLYLGPFLVAVSATFDRIGVSVTTAVAATTVRIGIYNGNGTGYPNALVLDAGTIDSSTTGFKEITISQTLTPAVYWIGCVAQGGAPSLRTMTGAWLPYVADTNGNVAPTTGLMAYSQTGVTGALSAASPFTSTVTTETSLPRVELRAV